MPHPTRRRFLSIAAGLACFAAPVSGFAAAGLTEWRGTALGADAVIRLAHPDANRLIRVALDEIARLEDIFSLYCPQSALAQLNAQGQLVAPAYELLDVLALSRQVYDATGGAFDPTVQNLWRAHAEAWADDHAPTRAAIDAALSRTGFHHVDFSETAVILRPGTTLTLNGIAQGYIADHVAALLRAEGLSNVLIDCGEIAALGTAPEGIGWPVRIADGPRLALRDLALATSAPLGTCFDAAGRVAHIIDPRTGMPVHSRWRQVSLTAPSAAFADAASTAACLARDGQELQTWIDRLSAANISVACLLEA